MAFLRLGVCERSADEDFAFGWGFGRAEVRAVFISRLRGQRDQAWSVAIADASDGLEACIFPIVFAGLQVVP